MKRFLLLATAAVAAFSFLLPSCKKTDHPTHPTPANVRMQSYSVTRTSAILLPTPVLQQTVTENYAFHYDANQRVTQIIFTSNDSNLVKAGLANTIANFTYSGSTVYKTVSLTPATRIIEIDTFMMNGSGQLTNSYFPNMVYNYTYYGQLLTHETLMTRDTNTTVSGSVSFTSNSGNFLKCEFNGNLTATFPDSGIRPVVIYPDTTRDSILSLPLTVTWTNLGYGGSTISHTASSRSDQLTGYSENPMTVDAVDANGIKARTGYYPEDFGVEKTYVFYGDQNRTGDMLQLSSFTLYGVNVFQNASLVKTVTSSGYTHNVTYTIDGDSKVTQTYVASTDKYGNNYTTVYNLQYETY